MMIPVIAAFHHAPSGAVQYVVSCPRTGHCGIIDPVLDFDPAAGRVSTRSADALLRHIDRHGLALRWILDTHPHADHLSAAGYLADRTGAPTATGAQVVAVQRLWKAIYDLPDLAEDGRQWNCLFADGDSFALGDLTVRVSHMPGHTLASVSYIVGDAAFIHDTLFMPEAGTARCDFPGGSAARLWDSIAKILALPDETRLCTGHDYPAPGTPARWSSTVAEQRARNIHLAGQHRDGFIALREARDLTLPMPRLMLLAMQVNIDGGRLPAPRPNGRRYLSLPLDALEVPCDTPGG